MEVYNHIIIKRSDGIPVNLHYEPVQKLRRAARFNTIEDYETFINGYYKPTNAALYRPQLIRITFEEVHEIERSEDSAISKDAQSL